jgi:hypothetical protein
MANLKIESNAFNVKELESCEEKAFSGGLLWVVGIGMAMVWQGALVSSLAAGLYASVEAGYNQAQK